MYSIEEYAKLAKERHSSLVSLSDTDTTKEMLKHYPEHLEYFSPETITKLYRPGERQRASHTKFMLQNWKTMLTGMVPAAVGVAGWISKKALDSDYLLDYAESIRKEQEKNRQEDFKDVELQGYVNWMEDDPAGMHSINVFANPDHWARGFTSGIPSIATMIATDLAAVGLSGALGGVGAIPTAIGKTGQRVNQLRKFVKGIKEAKGKQRLAWGTKKLINPKLAMFGMEGSSVYNETMASLIDEGYTAEEALGVAVASAGIYGSIASALEYFPYSRAKNLLGKEAVKGRFFKSIANKLKEATTKRGKAKALTKTVIAGALTESWTEAAQYLAESTTQHMVDNLYGSNPQEHLDFLKKALTSNEIKESGFSGFVMGTATFGLSGGYRAMSGNKRAMLKNEVERKVEDGTITKKEAESINKI